MVAVSKLARSQEVGQKVTRIFRKRVEVAQERLRERLTATARDAGDAALVRQLSALTPAEFAKYATDAAQRTLLFWATLKQRGDNFLAQSAEGLKPVLHFEHEVVLDARQFDKPVNYALLRIVPPAGVKVDAKKRPYVIIDPRAGHGPGIGGFKDDSQVGVALRAGHPVYFVIFFRDPEPGQTLLDVCEAERRFVQEVRRLHPASAKPAIVGNCQGGWAAMMLAAAHPEDAGPIVINGSPMSYWSGAWSEGEGDNPMRYAGGLLGGAWLASFAADLGNGKFDGAHLVQNFENLNPANSLWDKYYHLYDEVDTEPARFLEFERWWGGYYLMNREEIEWITRNLFVGNKLWGGEVKAADGSSFDLREIRSPIVLFASMGDNITPPQQAFNWVADVYRSSAEVKARGQVIVGLLHADIGHLGIFVSGKVAKKEHTQIVSVLKTIERLPPGVYGMAISERRTAGGVEVEVEFREHELEDIVARLNRLGRNDEKPFEAVAAVSEFNQRAYELFARPFVQALSNEATAEALRQFHPLRMQNWAVSALNPWLAWLAPAAQSAREQREAMPATHPLRRAEHVGATLLSAGLDYWRDLRDAATEAGFFGLYANLQNTLDNADAAPAPARHAAVATETRTGGDALTQGGYPQAVARVAYLLTRRDEPLPLSRLELRDEIATAYADYLPDLAPDEWRRVRGTQEVMAREAPDEAIATLPALLSARGDRTRLLTLLDKLIADPRVLGSRPTARQRAMHARIRNVLAARATRPRRGTARPRAAS
jgi:pimeloyl-ACP methyl ester carboxylesterase